MSLLDLIPGWAKLGILAALASAAAGLVGYQVHHQREIGRAEVRAEWDADTVRRQAAALAQAQANAEETARRLKKQQENDRENTRLLAAARADADRNRAAADSLREQNADAVRRWRAALDHPAAGGECAAAGDAIGVLADVLSRADRRAGI